MALAMPMPRRRPRLADAVRRATNASQGAAAAAAVVDRLAPLVDATADCISDMPFFNASSGFYELGPPTLGAEEFGDFMKIRKPAWETVYMAYALDVANEWRELRGLPRDAQYDAVAAGLGGLALDPAQAAPTYAFNAEAACCYNATCPPGRFGGRDQCSTNAGHPSPAAVLGLVNGRRFGDRYGVDQATANNTILAITENWAWSNGGGQWRCRPHLPPPPPPPLLSTCYALTVPLPFSLPIFFSTQAGAGTTRSLLLVKFETAGAPTPSLQCFSWLTPTMATGERAGTGKAVSPIYRGTEARWQPSP